MGQKYSEITDRFKKFIEEQKIFFVATAAPEGRVNVSPKGMDTLRILGKDRIVWLNFTGSGNETSAHVQENPRMTLMFAAFEGKPMILRLYGQARVIHMRDPQWEELFALFKPFQGARQVFDFRVDLVQTSCGMGVPRYDYVGERDMLKAWARKVGDAGIKRFWEKHNQISIDGKPTHILIKNTGSSDL